MFDTGIETYDIYEILDLMDRIVDIIKKLLSTLGLVGGSEEETE